MPGLGRIGTGAFSREFEGAFDGMFKTIGRKEDDRRINCVLDSADEREIEIEGDIDSRFKSVTEKHSHN